MLNFSETSLLLKSESGFSDYVAIVKSSDGHIYMMCWTLQYP